MFHRALLQPKISIFDEVFDGNGGSGLYWEVLSQYEDFDSFLFSTSLVGRRFSFRGEIFTGGEVNYVGVSALSGRHGFSGFVNLHLVSGHN